MRPNVCLTVLVAIALGACATEKPKPPAPPLVLGDYVRGTPRSEACASLIAQAMERELHGAFKLAGMLNTNTHPKPGESKVRATPDIPLVPLGSHPTGLLAPQLDGTFRSLFVNCETRQAYVSKRGGVIDITYWYGPFGL